MSLPERSFFEYYKVGIGVGGHVLRQNPSNNKFFPRTSSESHSSSSLQWFKEVTTDPHRRPRNQFTFLYYSLIIIVKHSPINAPKRKKIKAASLLRVFFIKSDPESSIRILPHFLFTLFWLIRIWVLQNEQRSNVGSNRSSEKENWSKKHESQWF